MRLLALLSLLLLASAFAQDVDIKYDSDRPETINGEIIGLVSHPSEYFNGNIEETKRSLTSLLEYLDEESVPTFVMVHNTHLSDYYHPRLERLNYVYSSGGQHKLKFPEARSFYIAGGIFDFCACRMVRDVLQGKKDEQDEVALEFNYVTDAIYVNAHYVEHNLESLSESTYSLKHFIFNENDEYFFNFIKREYLSNPGLCQEYGHSSDDINRKIGVDDYHWIVKKNGKEIGTLGDKSKRQVVLNFIVSADL